MAQANGSVGGRQSKHTPWAVLFRASWSSHTSASGTASWMAYFIVITRGPYEIEARAGGDTQKGSAAMTRSVSSEAGGVWVDMSSQEEEEEDDSGCLRKR